MLYFKDIINGRRRNQPTTNKKNGSKVIKKPESVKKQEPVKKVVKVPNSTSLDLLPHVIGSKVELIDNLNKKNNKNGVVVGYNHETIRYEIQLYNQILKF